MGRSYSQSEELELYDCGVVELKMAISTEMSFGCNHVVEPYEILDI